MNSHLRKAWLVTANAPAQIFSSYSTINSETDRVVAVDKGLERLSELDILPNLIIGDMDSVDPDLLFLFAHTDQIIHPQEKDETDTELAILWCMERNIDEIVICNDLGGRFDHALALIQNLAFIQEKGLKGSIESENQKLFLLDSETSLEGYEGCLLSLLALEGEAVFEASAGLYYPLEGIALSALRPRGNSNRITTQNAWIKLVSGKVLAIITK